MRCQRYQLNKTTTRVVQSGHPWIFRDQLSSAAEIFQSGQWLELKDSQNNTVGYGVYEIEGLIAIRVFSVGKKKPEASILKSRIQKRLGLRQNLRQYTNAFRAIHGENDGFPGIVVDVYANTIVLQTYASGLDALGRFIASVVAQETGGKNVLFKAPTKRQTKDRGRYLRLLRGKSLGLESITEGKLRFKVDLASGQKSGFFLDLRHLRKWLTLQKLTGKKVLNLFAYTGTLSVAAEIAGAQEIWNVDVSKGALEFGKKYHQMGKAKIQWVCEDIFPWVQALDVRQKFDLIIFDPPSLASQKSQVKEALAMYRRMYAKLREHVREGGAIACCCCTSRITRSEFKTAVENGFQQRLKFEKSLAPEDDHPVGFPEGDYLKVLIYRA